ncbi:MFS transporter [Rhizobium ruizarguesonis]
MRLRLALAYAAIFAIVGIHQPYWPLWLQYKGLGPFEIAILTALAFGLKIVATPLAARLADRTGQKRTIMIALAAGMSLGIITFFAASGFPAILIITIFAFACWSPLMSLLDTTATLEAKASGFDYGRIRFWGSVSLLIVTVSAGWLIEKTGTIVVLPALISACGLMLFTAFFLPEDVDRASLKRNGGTLRLFTSSDWFPLFISSTMLIQGSHSALYVFGSLSWKAHGTSNATIGALWALSILAEMGFFAFGRPVLAKFSSSNVIAVGGALAAIRWLLLAGFPGNIAIMALSQIFHASTFSASHVAAMRLISTHVDNKNSATAQGLYSSIIMGAGLGGFVFACGPLYALLEAKIFNVMAVIAALGAVLALRLKHSPFTLIDEAAYPAGRASS